MPREELTLIKHSRFDEITLTKYTCDVCKTYVWSERYCPKGWCTTREDHDNIICPDCNPYIKRVKTPNAEKLKLVEDAFIPSSREYSY